jgi:hypothetical protein
MQTKQDNNMDDKMKSLLNEFTLNFPGINFSGVDSGYDQVEGILCKHINDLTAEQWKVLTMSKYNDLFQTGTPHIDWNTDRGRLCQSLIRGLRPYKNISEFWYDISMYSIQMNGFVLQVKVEQPKSFSSGSRVHYNVQVSDVYIPVPSHCAVLISVGSDTKARISDQFTGSLNECEEWVAKNIQKGGHFKIMAI